LYYDLAQGAVVYNDSGAYDNEINGFIIYVTDYTYPPRDQSEIEIDHGGITGIVRYPVVSAVTESDFPVDSTGQRIYRLNLNSDTDGLVAAVPANTRVTLRSSNEIVLTGGVVGVAVRPSTALKMNELFDTAEKMGLGSEKQERKNSVPKTPTPEDNKNALMHLIIKSRDGSLLDEHRKSFSEAEIKYIEERIK
jgi:hypothetical protein